jgi:hypothetical protein
MKAVHLPFYGLNGSSSRLATYSWKTALGDLKSTPGFLGSSALAAYSK